MKKTLFSVYFIFITQFLLASGYVSGDFIFPVDSGRFELKGCLTVPETFAPTGTLLILIPSPQAAGCDADGLFSRFADVLSKRGIAVFRFENRAFSDSTIGRDAATMYTQVEDAQSAIEALKMEKRFAQCSFGLSGHSEGGCSTAIIAANREDISFLVLLSTVGINGADLMYGNMEYLANSLSKFSKKEKILKHFRNELDIVEKYDNTDTIKHLIAESIKELYAGNRSFFGKRTFEDACKSQMEIYTPRIIALCRFKPEKYYSKIKCPVLTVCGKWDNSIDYKIHIDGIKKIFKQYGKTNYKTVLVDSLDHLYCKQTFRPPKFVSESYAPDSKVAKECSVDVWLMIADWINKEDKYEAGTVLFSNKNLFILILFTVIFLILKLFMMRKSTG
jgi:alpha-beta hydrolase superfamily lysophospholipase